jgi:hypothetical protein
MKRSTVSKGAKNISHIGSYGCWISKQIETECGEEVAYISVRSLKNVTGPAAHGKGRILMSTVLNTIGRCGLVPVIKLDRSEDALPLGEALIKGGLPVAEVTFRTDAAEESIEQLTSHLPNLLVGAGTILTVDQVKKAVDAGAKFL